MKKLMKKIKEKMKFKKERNSSVKVKIVAASSIILAISLLITSIVLAMISRTKIENQMQLDGNMYVEEIKNSIALNNGVNKEVNELLGDKILTAAYLIGYSDNLSNEFLTDISKEMELAEINVADKDGKIIYSNVADNLNIEYSTDHPAHEILTGNKSSLVEDIRKSQTNDNYYKYGVYKRNDGGFVQIGILVNDIQGILNLTDNQTLISSMGENENIVYALTLDKNVTVRTHTDADRIGKVLDDEGSISAARDGKAYSGVYSSDHYKQDVYDVLLPLYDGDEHIGALNVGLSMKNVSKANKETFNSTAIIILFCSVLGILILMFITGKLIKPLKNLTEVAKKVSMGDLTEEVEIKGNDEITSLSNSFNEMIFALRYITMNINESSDTILSHCDTMLQSTEQSSAVSQEIAASAQELAAGSDRQLKATEDISQSTKDTVSTMNNVTFQLNDVLSAAEETTDLADDGQRKMNNMVTQMTLIKEKVDFSANTIEELQKTSEQIGNIVDLIDSIADQTNLLALNASIEAARAGEAGKGFAVVADEVRKLAEETMSSSNNIKKLIETTQNQSKVALKAIEEGRSETENGMKDVEVVKNSLMQITNGFELTKEKLTTVNEKIQETNTKILEINDKTDEISSVSENSAASTEQVAASIEEQTSNLEELTASMNVLKEKSSELKNNVSVFKM